MEIPARWPGTGAMQHRRLAAIMFTDIVGYTALMGADEKKAFEILKNNRRIQWRLIKKYKGRLLKEMGDGILASFPSNIDAVMCAVSIQNATEELDIPLRIGIHQGDVIFEKKDVLGDGVNIASRIQGFADTNGIVISETVHRDIKNKEGIETEFLGEKSLKGVESPVGLYKVICRDTSLLDYTIDTGELTRPLGIGKVSIVVGIGIIVVLVLALYYFFPKIPMPTLEVEKSIAVLPFKSLSDDPEKQYLADGVMDQIILHLSKIEDLHVISRTSVEKYRNQSKTIPEIASELNVNYILEGSFQKYGNKALLTVQLINALKEGHIWSDNYDRDYSDIFIVQSEVAQKIARQLHAVITPGEQGIIEIIPTRNLSAYDFFLRARDELYKYAADNSKRNALENAITLYRRALEYDSTYALAYAGLANTFYFNHPAGEGIQDSMLILANKALTYDDQLDEAYFVKGLYYNWAKGEPIKAINELDKALQINPNHAWAYYQKGWSYYQFLDNYVEGIKNFHKSASLDHSFGLPRTLGLLSWLYQNIGFYEKSIYYIQEKFKLDNDSSSYFRGLKTIDWLKSDFKTRLELEKDSYANDSANIHTIAALIENNIALGSTQEAYKYSLKLIELLDSIPISDIGFYRMRSIRLIGYMGYAFWQVGKQEEAKYYFDEKIKLCLESFRLKAAGSTYTKVAHYELAGVYAFLGDKEKAYQHLDQYNTYRFYRRGEMENIKIDPLFDGIREEERFQKIIENIEIKYQNDRERLTAWLEENDML